MKFSVPLSSWLAMLNASSSNQSSGESWGQKWGFDHTIIRSLFTLWIFLDSNLETLNFEAAS